VDRYYYNNDVTDSYKTEIRIIMVATNGSCVRFTNQYKNLSNRSTLLNCVN
jgi:hypothetical protein